MSMMVQSGRFGASLRVQDVFGITLRTGTGSISNTITNGLELSAGSMIWGKRRNNFETAAIFDTARGSGQYLIPSATNASANGSPNGVSAFNTNGYSVVDGLVPTFANLINASGESYVDWVFKEAPKFFDVVTWAGDASVGRLIPHSLGVAPGMIIVKDTSFNGQDWAVYHRSISNTDILRLNSTASTLNSTDFNNTTPSDANFSVGSGARVNGSGRVYVAYIFAHDPAGIVQCGSYTGNASTQAINLGWEPQWLLIKQAGVAGNNWFIFDQARGWTTSVANYLNPNLSASEANVDTLVQPTSAGFFMNNALGSYNDTGTYVYMAIRKGPM